MRFLDEVVALGDGTVACRAVVREDNPFLDGQHLPPWALVEFLAQAAAVLHALEDTERRAVGPGYLISVRETELAGAGPAVGEEIQVSVTRESSRGRFLMLAGVVHGAGRWLCRGRIGVVTTA
jgi:predicted hotdog family 3-hydroxylacyl-ACP dehydratase